MSEGWLRHDLGEEVEALSAGTHPCFVHPDAIAVMAEAIDISDQRSKSVLEFLGQPIDLVVTVCDSAREACPVLPGARKTVHEGIEDPVGNLPSGPDGLDDFRRARDEIRAKVVSLVRRELGLGAAPG
jgi:arsenate reductase